MGKNKITVAGIGPGSKEDITPAVIEAIRKADVVIGYKYYFRFIKDLVGSGTECIDTGMRREKERAELAFNHAHNGKNVCIISSGDAGIYGMAPLIYEMKSKYPDNDIEIETLPGISAFQKAASLLGAPIGHDFCVISLSDLMTSWEIIEKRIFAAAEADFVTAVYNPKSENRYWQLHRLKEIFLLSRSGDTPVGYVRQAGREEQETTVTTLREFDPEQIDMFTVIIIGNSQTYRFDRHMVTPRGYYRDEQNGSMSKGREIMTESVQQDSRGDEAPPHGYRQTLGTVPRHTHHSRFRYGRPALHRPARHERHIRQNHFRTTENDSHRCDNGRSRHTQESPATSRPGSEVLPLR